MYLQMHTLSHTQNSSAAPISVSHMIQRVSPDAGQIQSGVQVFVKFTNNSNIISSDNMQTQHNLLYALICTVHTFMTFIQYQVYRLVETFQSSNEIPSIRCNDWNRMIDVTFEAWCHGAAYKIYKQKWRQNDERTILNITQ